MAPKKFESSTQLILDRGSTRWCLGTSTWQEGAFTKKAQQHTFYAHLFSFDSLPMTHPIPTRDRLTFHSSLITFYNVKLSFIKFKLCSAHRNCVHLLLLAMVMAFSNWKNSLLIWLTLISSRCWQIQIVFSRFLVLCTNHQLDE